MILQRVNICLNCGQLFWIVWTFLKSWYFRTLWTFFLYSNLFLTWEQFLWTCEISLDRRRFPKLCEHIFTCANIFLNFWAIILNWPNIFWTCDIFKTPWTFFFLYYKFILHTGTIFRKLYELYLDRRTFSELCKHFLQSWTFIF
jgi:hypothetical protein